MLKLRSTKQITTPSSHNATGGVLTARCLQRQDPLTCSETDLHEEKSKVRVKKLPLSFCQEIQDILNFQKLLTSLPPASNSSGPINAVAFTVEPPRSVGVWPSKNWFNG